MDSTHSFIGFLGRLASGDIRHKIHLWTMAEGGRWVVDQKPLAEHEGSVEDLCWSPTEETMLASCSADHSIKLWDTRSLDISQMLQFLISGREIFQYPYF